MHETLRVDYAVVQFDANGDVSAPAVTWVFSDSGIDEKQYISLTEVNDFMASLN